LLGRVVFLALLLFSPNLIFGHMMPEAEVITGPSAGRLGLLMQGLLSWLFLVCSHHD
jgi:hypothetical protein